MSLPRTQPCHFVKVFLQKPLNLIYGGWEVIGDVGRRLPYLPLHHKDKWDFPKAQLVKVISNQLILSEIITPET